MRFGDRAIAEKNFAKMTDILMTNLLVGIVTLHDSFGFGAKRIDDYIKAFYENARMFDDMAADGVLQDKMAGYTTTYADSMVKLLAQQMKPYLSDDEFGMLFDKTRKPFQQVVRENSAAEKRKATQMAVSVAEAAEMQNKMLAMRDYLSGGGISG